MLLKIISWWIATDALWTGWTNFSKEYFDKARYFISIVNFETPEMTVFSNLCNHLKTLVTSPKDHMFLEINFLLSFFIKSKINWDLTVFLFLFSLIDAVVALLSFFSTFSSYNGLDGNFSAIVLDLLRRISVQYPKQNMKFPAVNWMIQYDTPLPSVCECVNR